MDQKNPPSVSLYSQSRQFDWDQPEQRDPDTQAVFNEEICILKKNLFAHMIL